jgi:sugar/nucleoside kinase (ribokinase family)
VQTDQNYLLVGTVTKDLLPDGNFTFGGTVTYATVIVKNLGWQPTIVTAAASDFRPPPYLAEVDWRILPSPETTTFRNEYDAYGHRRQTIGPVAQTISTLDIPIDCRQAPLVHLCPLAQELEPSITSIFKNSLLVATPQGWMRQWDEHGAVSLGEWVGADRILSQLKATVISLEDIEGDWTVAKNWAAQVPILIVTQGKNGCTVFHQGQRYSVPSRSAQQVDPTGAGDVFAAAFFIRFYETGNLWQSARFANVTASMAIERPGPEGAPSRDEIETYIRKYS